ncbi:glycoside hydrolase family 32 protein [Agriterribacter sp.]|uniref:glycoside hydrolase family 32 protein n=1 Tax=Agriterribacter sp. TaxID=2821509 RepID=UPI002CBC5A18|nr:glycoside hydrolase family 32 protein [Agriterribacter sp.]HRP57233.1 glycoside hydrolase family 32 protein [Agriterribacter sp.]
MKHTLLLLLLPIFAPFSYSQTSTREIMIGKNDRYLNFPVSMKDGLKKAQVLFEGKVIDEFTIHLSAGKPDYWVFFDASPYRGKALTVRAEGLRSQQKGFDDIFSGGSFPGEDSLYKEKLRPQVHFTSRRGWNNDPNGLVFANGLYHLFYQHNPYGTNWGNMHWGHAVSSDLLHWKEQPGEAWYTPDHDDAAFSGAAITDPRNTSGFRQNGIDPIIVFYTSTGRGECIALSYDNGKTFKEYEGNPVLKHKGRDPKVFWYAPGKHWVMAVYSESHTKDMGSPGQKRAVYGIAIYTSSDLKSWTFQSVLPGFYECPNLFQLPLEGDPSTKKWIIYGGSGKYKVGDFNGKKFTVEQDLTDYDRGGAFYASQLYENIPAKDGRQIQVAWARVSAPGMPFNQCMAFPVALKLKKKYNTYLLCPSPVEEIKTLHKNSHVYKDIVLDQNNSAFVAAEKGEVLNIVAVFERGDSRQFGLSINGYEITYDNRNEHLNNITYPQEGDILKMEVIVDKTIAEVFINDGELYFVKPLDAVNGKQEIKAFAKGLTENRKTILKKLEVHGLKSVWNEKRINGK